MAKPLNYSKWDHIEISDDEDETHPNIDNASLFRWRHEARLQREAEEKAKKEQLKEQLEMAKKSRQELESKLNNVDDDTIKKQLEATKKQEEEFAKKEAELERMEREHPRWNVDNICKPGFDKSLLNDAPSKPAPQKTEEDEAVSMKNFVKRNEARIKKYAMYSKLDDTHAFLAENLDLVCEETANYLVIWCLELEIEGKNELMKRVAHQCIIMQYILQVAKTVEHDPRATVNRFFNKFRVAEADYKDAFKDELKSFIERVQNRAKVKIAEAEAEAAEEERAQRLGPGGLDPLEVLESLPPALKAAFESRDLPALQKALAELSLEEAKYHIKRCEDSGLWVPAKSSGSNEDDEKDQDGEGEDQEEFYEAVDEQPTEPATKTAAPATATAPTPAEPPVAAKKAVPKGPIDHDID